MSSDSQPMPWWQSYRNDELAAHIRKMPIRDVEALSAEIGAQILNIQTQLSGANPSLDWRRSANRAKQIMAERRAVVRRVLAERNNEKQRLNNSRRGAFIDTARECIESGDLAEALRLVLDLLDHRTTSEDGEMGAVPEELADG